MARIRTVKPEFFTSEDVVALSPMARLLYIGLWCEADREGRLAWRPGSFRLRYLPTDACDIAALCEELTSRRLVVLYGAGLAYIPSFSKHQNINPRESASTLPAPPGDQSAPIGPRVSDASPRVSDAQRGREGREGVGKEGKGGEDARGRDAAPPLPVPRHAWLDLADAWNREAARVRAWARVDTGNTPAHAQGRLLRALRECPDLATWEARIGRASRSSHLTNRNGKGFVADLWWLIEHVAELDAGRYDDRAAAPATLVVGGGASVLAANDALLERIKQRELAAAGGVQ